MRDAPKAYLSRAGGILEISRRRAAGVARALPHEQPPDVVVVAPAKAAAGPARAARAAAAGHRTGRA